jgi:neutral ceramidase
LFSGLALAAVASVIALLEARCAVVTCACLHVQPHVSISEYHASPQPAPGSLRAGAAREDITPPPGYPLGGHSIAAGIGRGYWTRLYARAFYLKDRYGDAIALVSCDLFAIPAGLQAEVAAKLKDLGLDRDHVIVSATHTHQSPGNYMTSGVYNQFASPREGFDRPLFDFLVKQIEAAARGAYDNARASSGDVQIVVHRGNAAGILRNRAVEPFLLNADRDVVLKDAGPPPPGCPLPCERYRAVDDTLTLIEILRREPGASEHAIGLLAFFSGHPTSMSHETVLYNADYVGLAMARHERRSPDGKLVAGFFNGAEGDISPDWKEQNRLDAEKFATSLEASIDALRRRKGDTLDPSLHVSVRRMDARARTPRLPEGQRLANHPEFGAASIGGAEDGRTLFYDLGWRPGARSASANQQGNKLPAFDVPFTPQLNHLLKITRSLAPQCLFPSEIPVSLVRIDGLAIAAMPVEMTRTMWRRVRLGIAARDAALRWVVPIGLADEYLSYVTTPEEYAAQAYEGASMIFGPWTGPVIQDALEEMTAATANPPPSPTPTPSPASVAAVTFRAGPASSERFAPAHCGRRFPLPDDGLEPLIVDADGKPGRLWPRFEWTEPGGDDFGAQRRVVRIMEKPAGAPDWDVRRSADGAPADDTSGEILTVLVDGRGKTRSWAAIWLVPPDASASSDYMIAVRTADAKPGDWVSSKPFRLDAASKRSHPSGPEPSGGGSR